MSGKKTANIPDVDLFFSLAGDKKVAEEAFAELYARYAGRVYAYCYRCTSDPDEAQDIFQETFLRFYESAKRVDSMSNVIGFILKISRNLILNHRRNKKHAIDIDSIEILAGPGAQDGSELLGMLTTALDMLPDDYREAFVLREYEGLSYNQIAEILDTSLTNVKVRIFRAKQRLRKILSPYLADAAH